MKTQLINFTIPNELLEKIDMLARQEAKSRSEIIREAVRRIITNSKQKERDFVRIIRSAKKNNFREDEAVTLINEVRAKLQINK